MTAPSRRLGVLLGLLLLPAPAPADHSSPRDVWQRPQEVMDVLGIGPGSRVADVGCGDGYFTFLLAARVGPRGRVEAVDIDASDLRRIRARAEAEGLGQIETIRGDVDDPKLPGGSLDAVLIVNAYHEMTAYDAMLQGIRKGLAPGGLLGIIDKKAAMGEERQDYGWRHVIPAELVRGDAARNGFEFVREAPGFVRPRYGGQEWYFLVFRKAR